MKGSYVILIRLPRAETITIGKLADIYFPPGYYAYVGSALGGVKSRLSRHLSRNKKLRWHIDYLLKEAAITDIIIGESEKRVECAMAQALNSQFDSVTGFGSSDCHCPSHLFYATKGGQMKSAIMKIMKSLSLKPRLVKELKEE